MRNAFLVEGDNRVIKTSPCECHTGNPAPSLTPLLNRVLVRRGEDDDKQSRFQQARFLGFIGSSNEVIALSPYGVQRHHGEWRLSPLDDSESDLRDMKTALAQMAESDWRTLVCKTRQSAQDHKGWHSVECRAGVLPTTVPNTMCSVALVLTMRVWTMNRNGRKVLEHLHNKNHLRSQESSVQRRCVVLRRS